MGAVLIVKSQYGARRQIAVVVVLVSKLDTAFMRKSLSAAGECSLQGRDGLSCVLWPIFVELPEVDF